MVELRIFSGADSLSPSPLPFIDRMEDSARRAKPILSLNVRKGNKSRKQDETHRDPQLVICLSATALTPLLIPAMPPLRKRSTKKNQVEEGFPRRAVRFLRVIS